MEIDRIERYLLKFEGQPFIRNSAAICTNILTQKEKATSKLKVAFTLLMFVTNTISARLL